MDWENVYERFRQANINGHKLFSEQTIKDVKKLREWHRQMFLEYFDVIESGTQLDLTLNSFRSYRSPILKFLLRESINSKFLPQLTQDDIDNFIVEEGQKVEPTTLNVKIYGVKSYLDFHSKHLSFTPEYINFNKDEYELKNTVKALTSKELEHLRRIIKDQPFLQFIFELAYENKVRFEDSRKYCKENYNETEGVFSFKNGKSVFVSDKLREIILRLRIQKNLLISTINTASHSMC